MNIRVGVGVMILKEGKILLAQRKGSHGAGKYAFPGGHLEHGESFADCAIRETREEAGIEITNVRFQFVANLIHYLPKHYTHIGMIADWKAGEPQVLEPEKSESWGWYALDAVPSPLFESIPLAIIAHKTGRTSFDVADCPTSEDVYCLYEKFLNMVPLNEKHF